MSTLVIETSDGIRSIAINKPAKRNSLSADTLQELSTALEDADKDPDVRVILIHGLPTIFSAGSDLEEIVAGNKISAGVDNARHLISVADNVRKPLIAAVNGPAVGLAVTLLMACDLVYCGKHALFSLPFTALGETPLFGITQRLIAECGYHHAAEKLLLSEPITAEQAVALHIANGVFEDEDVLREATARAVRLTRMPPEALIRTKSLLRGILHSDTREQSKKEAEAFNEQLQEPEIVEAHRAFLEGRRPDFSKSLVKYEGSAS